MDEAIGIVQAEWRIDILRETLNGFHAWFRRPPRLELKHLASAIEQCLRTEVRFRNVTAVTPGNTFPFKSLRLPTGPPRRNLEPPLNSA